MLKLVLQKFSKIKKSLLFLVNISKIRFSKFTTSPSVSEILTTIYVHTYLILALRDTSHTSTITKLDKSYFQHFFYLKL